MQPHHLRSAPITEAIIDLRVRARTEFRVDEFSALKSKLSGRFPKIQERRGGKVTFQFSSKQTKSPEIEDLGLQGYFFQSEDESLIAQFRIDGFTLNKLKPYSSWDELFPIAAGLWEDYQSIAQPEAVTRIALRYINQIPLDQPKINFDEYFTAAPQIPPGLPQTVGAFFSRITLIDPDRKIAANVTQAFEPRLPSKNTVVIVDIDVFRELNISPVDKSVFDQFSDIHTFKNQIFFSLLTEKTIGSLE